MKPRMTDAELVLFRSFIANKSSYVEFGVGGSTVLASKLVTASVVGVDSSQAWLDKVAAACGGPDVQTAPTLMLADIGPIGEWGYPSDRSTMAQWPAYHSQIWCERAAWNADVYFIDGRFRVCCFLKSLLHCRPDSVLLLHDFGSRRHYHLVHDFAAQIAQCEDMAAFIPRSGVDLYKLHQAVQQYERTPD